MPHTGRGQYVLLLVPLNDNASRLKAIQGVNFLRVDTNYPLWRKNRKEVSLRKREVPGLIARDRGKRDSRLSSMRERVSLQAIKLRRPLGALYHEIDVLR